LATALRLLISWSGDPSGPVIGFFSWYKRLNLSIGFLAVWWYMIPSIHDSMDLFVAAYIKSNPKCLSVSTWDLLAAWCYTSDPSIHGWILTFILQARAVAFTKCVISNY
jgi:hypothetical protein